MNDLKEKLSDDIEGLSPSELVAKYLPMVRSIAFRVGGRSPSNVDVEDLVSVGLIGLMDAAEKYRPDQGKSFRAYAELRIRGTILDELRHMDWVPRSVRRKMQALDRARRKLETELQSPPSDEQVADELHMPMDRYHALVDQAQSRSVLSLEDLGLGGDEQRDILQALRGRVEPPDVNMRLMEVQKELTEAIGELPDREKTMVILYYFKDLPLKEIGKVLGVTESRVSQLHGEALKRLRRQLNKDTIVED